MARKVTKINGTRSSKKTTEAPVVNSDHALVTDVETQDKLVEEVLEEIQKNQLNTEPFEAILSGELEKNEQINTLVPIDESVGKELVKQPVIGSLKSDLRIFQIHYESWQKELLDPLFIALDNSKSTSELLEFDVFVRLFKSEYINGAKLWGALSWRFAEKTAMSGRDLINAIQANPGYDVYFCNPIPENEALYHNMWLQGEVSHPQFLALVQEIFKVTGLPLDTLIAIESGESVSAANYFVGTPRFWQAYLVWVQNILTVANKKLPPKIRDLMHSSVADDRNLHGGASYVPFIVERLFPLFMKLHSDQIKGFKILIPEREKELNVHVKLLREMKEMAHKTRSAWLAACWVNYRNLYLMQVKGKDWCQNYLNKITPIEIKFN